MVFHFGISARQYRKMSAVRRREGWGGKMYVPRAMYSFSTSFWIVPVSRSGAIPCSSATSWYSNSSSAAGELMVIEVDTRSRGIPPNSTRMSSIESIATPTLPTSPWASRASESWPIWVGRSKATDRPVVPWAISRR